VPRILVVEDERIVARDLENTLRRLGYEVVSSASSSDDALRFASERAPDLVLMDIRIKGELDGVEVARLLRERIDAAIVYITAYADRDTLSGVCETEPLAYLIKPFRQTNLQSVVEISPSRQGRERRRREREDWFSTTLRCLGDAVLTVDEEGEITFINHAAESFLGKSEREVLGRKVPDVVRLVDEQVFEPRDRARSALLPAGAAAVPTRSRALECASGLRAIEKITSPLIDASGKTLGSVLVLRDVSGRRVSDSRRADAERLASLGTFAAGMAHEINNPLSYITGNLDFIARELRTLKQACDGMSPAPGNLTQSLSEVLEAAGEVKSGAEHVARVVRDLAAFGQPSRGDARVDLFAAIDWAVRITRHEFAERARIVSERSPLPFVVGDEKSVTQVLVHLLRNAIQAQHPQASSSSAVTIATETDASGWAVVSVVDQGAGIEPELCSRIFEPFFTTRALSGGSGLGLSICHGIIKGMGGEIVVESRAGRGSTFRVRLPPATSDHSPIAPAAADTGRRGRLLVVDDEPMLLAAMKRMLRMHHDVVVCDSVAAALLLLETDAVFDLVLCDLNMPGLTGVDLYERVAAGLPALAERIVMITSGALTERGQRFLDSVNGPWLEKPISPEELIHFVQSFLRERAPVAHGPA
jgi:PAS domain S-box-containing protein